jgi:hypothetical protein
VQPQVYDAASLSRMGIASRGPSSDEARASIDGRYLYSDMPASLDKYVDGRTFAATRADIASVKRVAQAYNAALGTQAQSEAMAQTLRSAADRYFTLNQASSLDGAKFRQYIESTPTEQETLAAVQKLETMLANVKALGLPPVEYRQARERILASLASKTLPADQLARTVEKAAPAETPAPTHVGS